MLSSVMITPELLNQVGLPDVLEACHCRSPQGNRLKRAIHFYSNSTREELTKEFTAINQLTVLIKQKNPLLVEALTQLSRLRELRGTFNRLEKGNLLDDTEFFEIKSALAIFDRLSQLRPILEAAIVNFEDTQSAAALLDPGKKRNPAFHIYSEYSPQLSEIRYRKKELERSISNAKGADRKTLLTKRALVLAEEDQEEEKIRRDLGAKLSEWLPQMQHNADTCGLLDFRLAKADLAVRWKASQPVLVNPGEPALLVNVSHPLISKHLQKQGLEFTPISIEIRKGTTVISGANMGGKSITLKTTFLALLMCQLGFFPVCESLQTPVYDYFAYEAVQNGDLLRGLSSFGLEAVKIRDHYRRSRIQNGLIIMDEPCKGTNPSEATAIVNALSKIYGETDSSFLIATHYQVTPKPGVRFYQVRGIRPEALIKISDNLHEKQILQGPMERHTASGVSSMAQPDLREDLMRVRKIQKLMDYQLEEIDGDHSIPSGAIKIAELLGVDNELLDEMKAAWQEE